MREQGIDSDASQGIGRRGDLLDNSDTIRDHVGTGPPHDMQEAICTSRFQPPVKAAKVKESQRCYCCPFRSGRGVDLVAVPQDLEYLVSEHPRSAENQDAHAPPGIGDSPWAIPVNIAS